MKAIYKRELKSYFSSMTAYVVICIMVIFISVCSCIYNIMMGHPRFEDMLVADGTWLPISFFVKAALIISPALLAMKSFSEEKHEKTDTLLYSLPIKMSNVVMGKYFAMLTVYLIPIGIFCLFPLILSSFGSVNFLSAYSSILAYFLLCGTLLAISMFMSTLTEFPVIAAVISIGAVSGVYIFPGIVELVLPDTAMASFACIVLFIIAIGAVVFGLTKNLYAGLISAFVLEIVNLTVYLLKPAVFEGAFTEILNSISVFERFNTFLTGTFDLTAIVYYVSIIFVFVFLTVQSLDKKRYC